MKWSVVYAHSAWDDLRRLDKKTAQRIVAKIRFYAEQESPLKFASPLRNIFKNLYRFRIGDYRVIFSKSINSQCSVLSVIRVKHRKDAYKIYL